MARFIIIILSLGYSLVIAACCALPSLLWKFSLTSYISYVGVIFGIELFLGKLWNYHSDNKVKASLSHSEATNNMANAVQHAELICEYCGTKNLARILVGTDNSFTCSACEERNAIHLTLKVARTTQPIMPKKEAAEIFRQIDKDKK